MRRLLLLLIASGIGASACASSRPDLVLMLFDDLGWAQPASYAPETTFRMPNLDRVAREGMRFTDAHSASAVCTPSRYALLTGRFPFRIDQYGVLKTHSSPLIDARRLTLASMLKQQGYATACFGKWHLGLRWDATVDASMNQVPVGARIVSGPLQLGFDRFGGYTHAEQLSTWIEQDRVARHMPPVDVQPFQLEQTCAWIEERSRDERPFFLYWPVCPPHTPIVPSPESVGAGGTARGKDRAYYDWVHQGDAMLGALLAVLDRTGRASNTVLIVTSDNGAAGREYPPWRGSKRSIYEGGHRVPFVVRWPGRIAPGSVSARPLVHTDVLATVADLLDVELPPDAGEDSVSALATWQAKEQPERPPFVVQSFTGDLAIRDGSWKRVRGAGGTPDALYHLSDDPSERIDRAASETGQVVRLDAALSNIVRRGRSTPGPDQTGSTRLRIGRSAVRP